MFCYYLLMLMLTVVSDDLDINVLMLTLIISDLDIC
jgi:hypothetical protein